MEKPGIPISPCLGFKPSSKTCDKFYKREGNPSVQGLPRYFFVLGLKNGGNAFSIFIFIRTKRDEGS